MCGDYVPGVYTYKLQLQNFHFIFLFNCSKCVYYYHRWYVCTHTLRSSSHSHRTFTLQSFVTCKQYSSHCHSSNPIWNYTLPCKSSWCTGDFLCTVRIQRVDGSSECGGGGSTGKEGVPLSFSAFLIGPKVTNVTRNLPKHHTGSAPPQEVHSGGTGPRGTTGLAIVFDGLQRPFHHGFWHSGHSTRQCRSEILLFEIFIGAEHDSVNDCGLAKGWQ